LSRSQYSELGDDELVAQAASGNRAAFDEIHRRLAPFVHGILLSRLPVSECEDVLQDVFIAAFRGIATLRESANIGPWLAGIARHHSADYFRRHKAALVPLDSRRDIEAPKVSYEGGLILQEIKNLPEAYRETMVLRFVEGFTGPEIAGKTGLTHGSVRVNLSRGIELLRQRLGVRHEEKV